MGRNENRKETRRNQANFNEFLAPMEVLDQEGQFRFFRRLLSWRIVGRPQYTQFLDFHVCHSDIEAERDHLRVGDHFVRVLTMKETVAETRRSRSVHSCGTVPGIEPLLASALEEAGRLTCFL